jgi:peptidoglycan/LPS O-acetylase OafA/YrhL
MVGVRKATSQELPASRPMGDVGEGNDHTASGRQERAREGKRVQRVAQVLEDIGEQDGVLAAGKPRASGAVLDVALDHGESVCASRGSRLDVGLHADDRTPPSGKPDSQIPSCAADVQDARSIRDGIDHQAVRVRQAVFRYEAGVDRGRGWVRTVAHGDATSFILLTMSVVTQAPAGTMDRPVDASVPDVVAPPPGNPRFPLMDSLRALAALGVLVAHVAIFSGNAQHLSWGVVPGNLDVGVTLFFVLSGFLLYRPFFNSELGGAPVPRIGDYARRRVLRIVPAYWLALTVLALYPGVPGIFSGDWWRYYGFLQFYSYHTSIRGLGVAWTLCVEVAFYAVLPFYAAITRRATRRLGRAARIRSQLMLLCVLAVGSIVLRVADQGTVMQNSLLTHFYWFALGMALAVVSVTFHGRHDLPRAVRMVNAHPGMCWLAALIVYLAMCAVLNSAPQHLYYSVSQAFWQHVLSGVIAMLIVLPAVFGQRAGGWPRRMLSWRVLTWLGLISYGIYLWHATIATTLVSHNVQHFFPLFFADVALTITIAAASYHFVERPILQLKNRRLRLVHRSESAVGTAHPVAGHSEPKDEESSITVG